MKTLSRLFLSACLFSFFVPACTKNAGGNNKTSLSLSKQTVKRGEPLVAVADAIGSNVFVKWTVSPSANSWVSPARNKSVILFSQPGTYTITASYFSDSNSPAPYDSSSSPVNVSDSLYDSSVVACNLVTQVPIASGDQIIITPVSYSDTGLVLLAHTQHLYNNNPYIADGDIIYVPNGSFERNFNSIVEYPCVGSSGATQAVDIISFSPLKVGEYGITFKLNNISYQGILTVNSTSAQFTWGYTSGILISPLQIPKQ